MIFFTGPVPSSHPATVVPFMATHQVKIEPPSWSEASRAGSQGKLRNEDGLWMFMVDIYIYNIIYIVHGCSWNMNGMIMGYDID